MASDRDLQRIWRWNAIVPDTIERCIHDLIAETARRQPNAQAVCAWDGELTYKELDELSTRLSHQLKTAGLGQGIVPLCFEKSVWMPVAMLAVMKAGGACVALDVTLPEERLRGIVQQVQPNVILSSFASNTKAVRIAGNDINVEVVDATTLRNERLIEDGCGDDQKPLPSDLLYVVFTSGSTGSPKGAKLSHRNLASALYYQSKELCFDSTRRVLDFASYAFDIAWFNCIFTLCSGGCLCIGSHEEMRNDPAACIQRYRVNFAHLTPSLTKVVSPEALSQLDVLVTSGETLTASHSEKVALPKKIINAYGPAECTPHATAANIGRADMMSPPIGRGYGVCTWVVDMNDENCLVPIGDEGELWLEGPIVGEGYLGQANTSSVFVVDPPWLLGGALGLNGRHGRLYKTGDIVRQNQDGTLAFIRRKDAQVKINGQRVELGEVEYHVKRLLHGNAQLVAEVIKPCNTSNATLVIFICIDGFENMDQDTLRTSVAALTDGVDDLLAQVIPSYMIPSAYIPLDAIPMTATGKTDRRILREMGSKLTTLELAALDPRRQAEFRQPSTMAEKEMQSWWATVLGIDASMISLDDSFLHIGGDSILAMKLVGMAREHGLILTVAEIFQRPRLFELAHFLQHHDRISGIDIQSVPPFSLLEAEVDTESALQYAASICGLDAIQIQDIFPCTPLQEGLLAMTVRRPGDYISERCFTLQPGIDVERFKKACEDVVAGIPILRTRIIDLPGHGLVQVTLDENISWGSTYGEESSTVGSEMGLSDRLTQFSLNTDHDLKIRFRWRMHHALYDGWSMPMMLDAIDKAYQGENSISVPFQNFIHYIQNIDLTAAQEYWTVYFEKSQANIFPAIPSAAYTPYVDRTIEHTITALQWAKSNSTASTTIRTAWAILQGAYTSSNDVAFGATVTGRQAALQGVEQIVAPAIATVPVRIILNPDQKLADLLTLVQQKSIDGIPYEQMGLREIRRVSQEAEHGCNFQTLLVVQPRGPGTGHSKVFEPMTEQIGSLNGFNTYALQLICTLVEDGLHMSVSFDSNVIQKADAERILSQFEHLLRLICDEKWQTRRLCDLKILSDRDLQDIWNWNADVPETVEDLVHQSITEMARKQPDSIAIHAWDGMLTYAELDAISSRLGLYLTERGIQANVLVPLCFEKSMWTPVTMLAVMKAGGASVLLDCNQPEERLRAIIRQLSPHIILSSAMNKALANRLYDSTIRVEVIGKPLFDALNDDIQAPNTTITPSALLYVVFTSGSTGKPKGVKVSHRNFTSAVKHQREDLGFKLSSRVLDFASYAFDMAWSNFIFTLCTGGCLCIGSQSEMRDDLAACLQRYRISFVQLTPSLARTIDPGLLSHLDVLLLAGEGLSKSDVGHASVVGTLLNAYGPAECTVCATAASLRAHANGQPPIGKGIGQCTWVVNPEDETQLVPIGVEGELWLEGPLVGQGYLDNEQQTAAAFVQNPTWLLRGTATMPGRNGRLYRTGDLVRYTADGSLIFTGRKDSQVKIRGQRVELSEVEYHITQLLPSKHEINVVAEAVTPCDGNDQIMVLFIHVVGFEDHAATEQLKSIVSEIKSEVDHRLHEILPSYMIPSAFIPIPNLPLTTTGKTDRKTLRALGNKMSLKKLLETYPNQESQKRPPSTKAEEQMRSLWATVLGMNASEIGIDDSFLRIGGDSIQAMRLVSMARTHGLLLSVEDVFKQPRLSELSTVAKAHNNKSDCLDEIPPFSLLQSGIDMGEAISVAASICAVDVKQIQDIFPCTPLQEGLIAMTEKHPGQYVSQNEFELLPWISLENFRVAIEKIATKLPILRTRIVQLPGEGFVQVVVDEQTEWTLKQSVTDLKLGNRLSVMSLTTGNDGKNRFSWLIHHAIYDGWSFRMVLDLLGNTLRGNGEGPWPLTFQPFIQYIQSMDVEATHRYWQAQFEGCEAAIFPTPPSPAYRPRVDSVFEHTITNLIWPLNDITPSTAIRTAWSFVQATYTGVNDVVFGVTVSGRQIALPGIERVAGPAIATVPVRITIDSHLQVKEILQRIQQQSTESVMHEQFGLQAIRRVNPEAELGCDFQTLVVIQPAGLNSVQSDVFEPIKSENEALLKGRADMFSTYALESVFDINDAGVSVTLNFDSAVVGAQRMKRMAQLFEHFLRLVCSENYHQTSFDNLAITSRQDLQDIWDWNGVVPETVDACIHDIIAETSIKQPEAPAICAWDGDLTYRELDDLSTRLSDRLVELGVGRNTPVPLLFEKSMWMPVAMLAVMKAGGASVAMDRNQPEERLRTIISQIQAKVILSSSETETMASHLSEIAKVEVVSKSTLDILAAAHIGIMIQFPKLIATPSDLLYIVFTSGSTGQPKGAMISHKNFASAIRHQSNHLGFTSKSRVLDFASYAFDMAWSNFLFTLCVGGCLCIGSYSEMQNDLTGCLQRYRISFAQLTPSLARTVNISALSSLDTLILAGEGLQTSDIERCAQVRNLINAYGPAECSICATAASLVQDTSRQPIIGRGIGQCTWIVEPEHGSYLVPVGVEGELWLEGPLVGLGYLDNERTANAFVNDPPWLLQGASGKPGRHGRLYKTGDLVRYNADGTLVFIGRKDSQVKIRGQRVELAEVEFHVKKYLQGYENLQVAAEIVTPRDGSNQTLIAFLATQTEDMESQLVDEVGKLYSALSEAIPSYMIPAAFIPVKAFPMTTTGKTDRKKLREMGNNLTIEEIFAFGQQNRQRKRKPRTLAENKMRSLWAGVLEIDISEIGIDDSFLRIGGDSIQSMKLVRLAREQGLSITVADIFEHPQLCELVQAATITEQAEQDHQILPFSLLKGRLGVNGVRDTIAMLCGMDSIQIQDAFPCTPLQEGLLALTEKEFGNYISHNEFILKPETDLKRFKWACEDIFNKFSILRTRIVDLPGQGLVQVVVDEVLEWQSQDGEESSTGLGKKLSQFRLSVDQHHIIRFSWEIHHALYDGWSFPILLNAISSSYEGQKQPSPTPFQVFIHHIQNIDKKAAHNFWETQFRGLQSQPFPSPPSIRKPRAAAVLNHVVTDLQWPENDITASTAVRAAWALVHKTYTSSDDVVFGTIALGRQIAVSGIEEIAGPTIATIPVRIMLNTNDQTVDELLQQVQMQAIASLSYEQIGLQEIRRVSQELERACDFQTLLVVQPAGQGQIPTTLFEPTIEDETWLNNLSTYPLLIICELTDHGVKIRFSFDSTHIGVNHVKRVARQLEHILRIICTEEHKTTILQGLDLVTEQDLQDIWKWNATVPETQEACVHNLIAATIKRQPDVLAVDAWDGKLTYKELDYFSTLVAIDLVQAGVTPDMPVPLCFEKSMWMPVAILGVMKAGGVSVAMDSSQPEERLWAIVRQVHPSIILSSVSNASLAARLSPGEKRIQIKVLGQETLTSSETVAYDAANAQILKDLVTPSNSLYIIFTSGSTGQPKGSRISHKSFASAMMHQMEVFGFSSTSRVIDFASYAFDMPWTNYLFTFYAGGCLCIRSKSEMQNDLVGCLQRYQITYAFLTPSLARTIDSAVLSKLDVLAFGGEGLLISDVARCAGIGKIVNIYGPSECTPCSTAAVITDYGVTPQIGHGYGQCTWIVDPEGGQRLVPIGAEGELWLEGPLVGQGYLDDRQTLATYVEDPSWLLDGAPGAPGRRGRFYKTGDLVRYDTDGSLVFCGRKDSQVKIRGQRVELSEVEYHAQQILNSEARVIAEIVVPRFSNNALLVMFICIPGYEVEAIAEVERLETEVAAIASKLQDQMSKKIPSYMVPSAFIPISTMPMTGTGKTDRRALRDIASRLTLEELAALQPQRQDEYREPHSITEKCLQELWSVILGINAESISADDSFLRIGGDSIQAMRLVGAAREQGWALTVADIFEQPRLCDLAGLMKEVAQTTISPVIRFSLLNEDINLSTLQQQAASLCGVDGGMVEDIYPCTPLQEGLIAMTEKHSGDYISQNLYALQPEVDIKRFKRACEHVVTAFPILRTRIIDLLGQGLVQVVLDEHIQWNEPEHNMGLGTRLTTFELYNEGAITHLSWTIHHALYDGWSFSLLINAIEKAYGGQSNLQTIPFQKYIQYIQKVDTNAAIQFWKHQFEGSSSTAFPLLPSPTYTPRANTCLEHKISDLNFPKTSFTPSTAIRTAWALVQGIFTNSDDVVFGATVTGRQATVPGIEQIAAPLIATVPVRIMLDPNAHVSRLLQQIQQQSIDSIPYEHIGLQEIRKVSQEAEQGCSFQTLLVIQPPGLHQDHNAILKSIEKNEDSDTHAGSFSTYALELICTIKDSGVHIFLSFDSEITNEEQTRRIMSQFEHILRLIYTTEVQAMKINEIQIANEQDIGDIWKWNAFVPDSLEICVHDLLSQTIKKQPNSPAIEAWDGQLTYGELDQLSSHLALHLIRQGVRPNIIVPLCFEKSVWTPVAMLAVMKAGGASVVLDSTQPINRLRSIVQQVQPKIILASISNEELASELVDGPAITQIVSRTFLDGLTSIATPDSRDLEEAVPQPSDLLYVVFTSGSTGIPKGVLISHSNIASTAIQRRDILGFKPNIRVLDFASYAFDMSWFNYIFTLYTGGCLCIGSQEEMHNDLSYCIQKYRVSYVQLTPSLARSVDLQSLSNLDVLALAGEALTPSDARYFSTLDKLKIVNIYGPAECTPCSTSSIITSGNRAMPPIGRGRGLRTWVVDQETESRLVPIGIEGELWLEGPLVGQGYLNDQGEQNSVAFVEDPKWLLQGSADIPGRRGRLYKTRDLVRYNTDGELIFVGRKDSQVKIRGQRVELAEIEHHVRGLLPNDQEIQVMAEVVTPLNSTSQVLIAFINSRFASQGNAQFLAMIAGLDSRLIEKIPSYMIPAAFMPLKAIPMTATGKTDRKALREMGNKLSIEDIASLHVSQQLEQPKMPLTPAERRLRQLWASILNIDIDVIDSNTSFLRIGGDSIQAMRLVAAGRENGLHLTVADIFKQPRLCDQVKQIRWGDRALEEEPIAPFSLLNEQLSTEFVCQQAASLCNVAIAQIEDVFPCTPLQQGLLAMTQKRMGNYIAQIEFTLQQRINVQKFIKACDDVSEAIPILRTRFIDLPGQGLTQVIINEPAQWRGKCDGDRHLIPSNDNMGLNNRLSTFRLRTTESSEMLFSWEIHHALYDNFLVSMVLDAINKAYQDEEKPSFVPFQRFIRYIHTTDKPAASKFWKEYFSRGSQVATFPLLSSPTYAPIANTVFHTEITDLTWPETDITPSTALRTAWALVQTLYTSSSDVVFGCTVTGRQAAIPEAGRIAGPTIATVPVRVQIPEELDISIKALQSQIQEQSIESIPYEQMGLQEIRKVSAEAEQGCGFQTLLVLQPATAEDQITILRPLETRQHQQETSTSSTYSLEVVCDLSQNSVRIQFNYDSNVIRDENIRKISGQLEHLLRLVCAKDEQETLLRDMKLINQSDLRDIWNWNASVPETVEECIHDMISDVARRRPDAPAICAWDGELTYMQLESLAYSLSLRLMMMGIGPNVLVPLCFEKSMWTPVTVLAVMKAGGASILLDVSQPEDRLQMILHQIQPKVILSSATNKPLAHRLQEKHKGTHVLDITKFFDDILSNERIGQDEQLTVPVVKAHSQPSDLLYVVFTSGSTGTPKGALIRHQNFASAIRHQSAHLGFNSTSRVLDFASYAFDMAWSCLLFALCNGGCLCIGSQTEIRNDLSGCFHRYRISHASLTPSVARTLDESTMLDVDVLLLAGEAMSSSDITRFKGIGKLLNAYGPAECSVCATAANLDHTLSNPAVSIGQGIGQRTWVVDPNNENRLVPVGVEGELWLEGPLVGKGYLNDEERTFAAFIDDPSWLLKGLPALGIPGRQGRLYKTGDLVRYQTDGTLIFMGRKDSQVKIRGQRLELGEVEHHVQRLIPKDQDVRVVAEAIHPRNSSGNAILAMFMSVSGVDQNKAQAAIANIAVEAKEHLAKLLPSYMVPSVFIPIAAIPMTATGKIDRKTLKTLGNNFTTEELAALDPKRPQQQRLPATAADKRMQHLWASVLGIDASHIYLDDSFLSIGGDSIQAMRLVVAAREQGFSLTIADIFKASHLSELVQMANSDTLEEESYMSEFSSPFSLLGDGSSSSTHTLLETITKLLGPDVTSVTDVYPVTVVQADFIEMAMLKDPRSCAAMYFDFPSEVTDSELERACTALWARFDILRAIFVKYEGKFFHVISDTLAAPVHIHTLLKHVETSSTQFHTSILSQPLQLGKPYSAFYIQRHSTGLVRLTIRIAHAQYDGITLGPLLASLSALLSCKTLPTVPQFSQYIKHTQRREQQSLLFWRDFLQNSQPLRMPSPRNLELSVGKVLQLSKTIPTPTRIEGTTSATLFVSGCAQVVANVTQSTDVIFGLIVSGRASLNAELKDVAGPCLNIIPIRAKIQQGTLLKSIIKQVHNQRHHSIGYETAGSKNILQSCTDWPQNLRRFNFIVQFQNIDESPTLFSDHGPRLNVFAKPSLVQTNDIFVIARPTKESWAIEISGSDSYDLKQLGEILDGICASMSGY